MRSRRLGSLTGGHGSTEDASLRSRARRARPSSAMAATAGSGAPSPPLTSSLCTGDRAMEVNVLHGTVRGAVVAAWRCGDELDESRRTSGKDASTTTSKQSLKPRARVPRASSH